ncbi:MAG: sugar phosphate isomerase/epimerase [Clostridia bacterium]|nr:sugar phosphate isomerase/epimerase [Clostridia bacterium]
MKIGIFLESLRKEFKEGVLLAKKMGVNGFQIYAGSPTIYVGMSKDEIKNIKAFLADNEMEISALCGDMGHRMFYFPDEMREQIEHQKKVVDLAEEFGVNAITTHIGVIPENRNTKMYETMASVYKELADCAANVGAHFAIETGPEPSARLKSFLDEIDSKGKGVNFDPANLAMVQGENPVEGVKNLKDYIVHTHAKDGKLLKKINSEAFYISDVIGVEHQSEEGFFIETPLGDGDVPWKDYIAALKSVGYDGFLTVEREVGEDPVSDIRKAVTFLKAEI